MPSTFPSLSMKESSKGVAVRELNFDCRTYQRPNGIRETRIPKEVPQWFPEDIERVAGQAWAIFRWSNSSEEALCSLEQRC